MTIAKARAHLAQVMTYLHLSDEEFSIKNRRLVSENGVINYPIASVLAIIPAHGSVMVVRKRRAVK